ncbi:hypothetical protein K2173_013090 [Erythroxylum novogranatense]|uniref:S-protein homolog n=1 Tax=Erythroxylum novogranatense TaxID=1862640 RepID=A0AAV8S584_9ROSI|nr:hypothetical protein K2173_013090 [Erythroxylum novogranatense]
MNLFCKFVLLFVLVTSVKSSLATSESGSGFGYTTVKIFNQMKDGSNLTVHCRSGDDDLGTHVVDVGRPYQFRFRVNFWGTTLFSCNAYWRGKIAGFNCFDAKRDGKRCKSQCVWKGSEDGIFGYPEGSPNPDLHYAWR